LNADAFQKAISRAKDEHAITASSNSEQVTLFVEQPAEAHSAKDDGAERLPERDDLV